MTGVVSRADEESNLRKIKGLSEQVKVLIDDNRRWGPSRHRLSKAKQVIRRIEGAANKVPVDELGPLGNTLKVLRSEFGISNEIPTPSPDLPHDLTIE